MGVGRLKPSPTFGLCIHGQLLDEVCAGVTDDRRDVGVILGPAHPQLLNPLEHSGYQGVRDLWRQQVFRYQGSGLQGSGSQGTGFGIQGL